MVRKQRPKERGKEWESYVAQFLGGVRKWAGPGTDVEARGRIIECKSQIDYRGLKKLVEWIHQAKGYGDNWALAVRLGQYKSKLTFVVISMEEYERLTRDERERENHQHGLHVHPDNHVPDGDE